MTDDPQHEPDARPEDQRPAGPGGSRGARARIEQQGTWVDLQLRQAMDRGDFDRLPGFGKPLADLGDRHDPDWWVKRLVEREQITGVVPPSLQVRREDAELDARLDRLATEDEVRREVEEFNGRVRWALYRPPEGPPVVTPQRDADAEVRRWHERREARRAARLREARAQDVPPPATRRAPWWSFRRRLPGRCSGRCSDG